MSGSKRPTADGRQPTAEKIRDLLRDIRDRREGFAGVSSVDYWKEDGSRKSAIRRKSKDKILDEVEKRLLQIAKEATNEQGGRR